MADFNFLKISPIKTNLLTIMKGCVERKPTALFLILGWILGLFDMRKTGLLYKLYSGFLLLFHIISYFIGIFAICPHAPKAEQSKGLTSAKEVLGIILTLSLFFTVLSLVFWNSKCFHELMELIAEFDRSFASAPENGYVMFFIAIVELSLLTILQSSIIGGNTTSKINEFLFGQGLQRMTMSTAYYLRWVLTLRVDRRFIVLNRCLEKLFHKKNRHEIISENQLSDFTIIFRNTRNESHDKNKHFLNSLKKISKFHNSMCDALNLLNKIFGLNMMCEVVFTIAFVSQSTMNVIVQSEDFMENSGINRGTTSCLILVDISVSINLRYTYPFIFYSLS